ncbi:MAG: hypothetical protein U5R14_11805 [Gemmatimonadota bacterium]|nr:hypothetical protein [Gemmatimonadota bacterium]
MQSEHLTNLHPGWVVGGWLIAVSVTAALYLGGVGLGLVVPGSDPVLWVIVSIGGGFYVGGLFVGLRWTDAPILHAAAISFFSVLVWFFVTLFSEVETFDAADIVLGLVLVQLVAATLGGWMGRRVSLGQASDD